MLVYVLEHNDYDMHFIYGIFSSEEKMKEYVKKTWPRNTKNWPTSVDFEVWELDNPEYEHSG